MKDINTDELVRKYLAAETTLEEEVLLQKAFLHDETAEEHAHLKALFGYYQLQKQTTATPDFKNPATPTRKTKRKVIPMTWIAVAASVVVLVSAWFFFNFAGNSASTDTFTDPEIAAQNAAEAIQILSGELNKGRSMAMDQMKEFDNLNKYLTIF